MMLIFYNEIVQNVVDLIIYTNKMLTNCDVEESMRHNGMLLYLSRVNSVKNSKQIVSNYIQQHCKRVKYHKPGGFTPEMQNRLNVQKNRSM